MRARRNVSPRSIRCRRPDSAADGLPRLVSSSKAWNAKIAQLKHDRGVRHAESHAERLEWEASFAVDYAVAAIEEAKSAVLDAIVGRIEAEEVSRS